MVNKIMRLGKLEIDLKELSKFLVGAKKNCYAGNGEEKRLSDGSKILTFQEGNFHYEDNYDGFYQAPGRELVRWKNENGQRIWQMSYCGGMNPEYFRNKKFSEDVFRFLKIALGRVSEEMPFRGPEQYEWNINGWNYSSNIIGDVKRFIGNEFIKAPSEDILFSLDFIGGLFTPK
ncbi:MAG: DUF5680 domain-containing protein [Candidatus Pacearchaeota archaeon]